MIDCLDHQASERLLEPIVRVARWLQSVSSQPARKRADRRGRPENKSRIRLLSCVWAPQLSKLKRSKVTLS